MTNKNYSKPLLIGAAAITALAVAVLLVFGGNTVSNYTFANLSFGLFVNAFVCALLVVAVTTGYFAVRFKKNGVYLGLYSALSALICAVVAFDLCVICRAPLGDLTFAVMLTCVVLNYMTAVVFANSYVPKITKKKKQAEVSDPVVTAVTKTRKAFSVLFVITIVTLVAAAVISFVFSAFSLSLCATPAILSIAYSLALSLSFSCRLYAQKI